MLFFYCIICQKYHEYLPELECAEFKDVAMRDLQQAMSYWEYLRIKRSTQKYFRERDKILQEATKKLRKISPQGWMARGYGREIIATSTVTPPKFRGAR